MNRLTCTMILALTILAVVWAPAARADVSISITISGSIDELLPILRQLQTMGVGSGESAEDPLKLNVHSIMTGEDVKLPEPEAASGEAAAPAPEPVAKPEPPKLGFQSASVMPATAKVGEGVLFTATVSDPDHLVDTVGLTIGDVAFDLFDNGANGDQKAMDGIWSRNYKLPASLVAGDYVAMITAYDVNGEPVIRTEEGQTPEPVATEVSFTVVE